MSKCVDLKSRKLQSLKIMFGKTETTVGVALRLEG